MPNPHQKKMELLIDGRLNGSFNILKIIEIFFDKRLAKIFGKVTTKLIEVVLNFVNLLEEFKESLDLLLKHQKKRKVLVS